MSLNITKSNFFLPLTFVNSLGTQSHKITSVTVLWFLVDFYGGEAAYLSHTGFECKVFFLNLNRFVHL